MSQRRNLNSVTIAVGAAFTGTMIIPAANARGESFLCLNPRPKRDKLLRVAGMESGRRPDASSLVGALSA
jgi:hypothetical protein